MMDKKTPETLQILYNKMNEIDFHDSYGTIIMRNGSVFRVPILYELFHQAWLDFMGAITSGDKKKIREAMEIYNGGIVSNGELTINLADVSTMISNYEINKKEIDA